MSIQSIINGYRNNKVIMDFVTKEAYAKVSEEINEKINGSSTGEAVRLLSYRHKNIADRVEAYINTGLIGCYMASVG